MIWYFLTEDHRITKTIMLSKNRWSPGQMLPPKCSPPSPLRAKILISPQAAVFEKFVPQQKGGTHYALVLVGEAMVEFRER